MSKGLAILTAGVLLATGNLTYLPEYIYSNCILTTNAADVVESGVCGAEGDNLTWTPDDEGTLTISGEGEMENWLSYSTPWYSHSKKIISVIMEKSVTSIGDSAFSSCDNLASITIPDSVTSIGSGAFYGCYNLTSITIPNSITSIKDEVFVGCLSLTSVIIPDSVTSIGNEAFRECCSLTSIKIPDSVTSIGVWAFESCSSLTSITIENPDCKISDYPRTICNGYDEERDEFYFTGTIYGYAGSTAEAYAQKFEDTFVALKDNSETASGDVNGDGILDISDAIFLARVVAEDTTMDMSNYHEENADANGDGTIYAADTVMILKKIAKLI